MSRGWYVVVLCIARHVNVWSWCSVGGLGSCYGLGYVSNYLLTVCVTLEVRGKTQATVC